MLPWDSPPGSGRRPLLYSALAFVCSQIAIAPRSPLLERWSQVAEEPVACQYRYLIKGSGLFEEVRGAGNNREATLAAKWS